MTTTFSSKSDVASCGVGEDEDEERGLLLLRKRGRSPSMERRDLVDEAMGGESVKKKRVRRGKTRRASLRSTVETKVEEEKAEVEVVVEKELENVDDDASLPMLSPVLVATTLGCTCSDMNSEGLRTPAFKVKTNAWSVKNMCLGVGIRVQVNIMAKSQLQNGDSAGRSRSVRGHDGCGNCSADEQNDGHSPQPDGGDGLGSLTGVAIGYRI
ncbi:hypothetical protein BDN72DRAFT_857994 [Pluteus cervinus]|uniref:Uncharacterized protein n=1 Tax=Pluteus cervinus TaxID=181527 RepID=A0ACD3ATH0_9AGAR|nr:hypothetical protein BDN72DRAFT_857994 [Pluteus cervinus]